MRIKYLLLILLTANAWGYSLTQDFVNGFYWSSLPVNITVVDSNSSRKALIERLSEAAVREWEQKSGLSLWSFTSGSQNIIRWSTNFASDTRMDPNSVLAVAIRYTNGPYFAKAEIIINGGHHLLYNSFTGQINEAELRTTITHELGHTMGLDHSNVMMAVMAPTLQSPYYGLHADDVAGVRDAHSQMEHRQLTGFISPLAYKTESSAQALNCGSIGPATSVNFSSGLSLGLGILIGFVRKIFKWFKSRL